MAPIGGETRLAAVIGSPISHSLSPALHNAAFESAGADWRFVAFEVAAGGGAEALSAMRALGIKGFAVTTPLKAEVAAAVDEVDPAAANLRSVNTVVLGDDGRTFGASTDGAGFVGSLEASGVSPTDRRVVVFGAGGAARSIVDALGRAGVAEIVVVNRSADAARAAAELAPNARVGTFGDVPHADIVVNATSVGMGNDDSPLDPALLRAGMVVADIVYHPLETSLLRAAAQAGARTIDGLGMLVHQAAHQQRLWTGVDPDVVAMRAAAEAALAVRARSTPHR